MLVNSANLSMSILILRVIYCDFFFVAVALDVTVGGGACRDLSQLQLHWVLQEGV